MIQHALWIALMTSMLLLAGSPAGAQDDLAKQSQNPLGTIISLPFENNLHFGIGPSEVTACALNWKPVYLGDWNLQFTVKILLPKK